MKLVRDLDGTCRSPNTTQKLITTFLQDSWLNANVFGLGAPVASGKSFIARALQRTVPGTVIITPHNQLIQQYVDSYPELNSCIGREHYRDSVERDVAFGRYQAGAPSIFNLASYWYGVARVSKARRPKLIILDEADACVSMLREFGSREIALTKREVGVPLIDLLRCRYASAEATWLRRSTKRNEVAYRAAKRWYEDVRANEQNYSTRLVHTLKGGRLTIESLVITPEVQRRFFGDARVVLMSGTLAPHDLESITGRVGVFESFPSPIAVTRRPIYRGNTLQAAPNYGVDISWHVRRWVDRLLPIGNGILHATYADAAAWAPLWPDVLSHRQSNKALVLQQFISKGGVLLGCGMAAGVDLPGDLCRWNLIPRLQFPNLSDDFVQRRKALADGQRWYDFEALRHVMQATGRSTRNPADWSVTVILDPRIHKLITKYRSELPEWFLESLVSTDLVEITPIVAA